MSTVRFYNLGSASSSLAAQTAINAILTAQEAAGNELVGPPIVHTLQDADGDVTGSLSLTFAPAGATSSRGAVSLCYDYPENDTIQTDVQALIDANEEIGLRLIGGPVSAIVGKGPTSNRVLIMFFGLSPETAARDLEAKSQMGYATSQVDVIISAHGSGSTITNYRAALAASSVCFGGASKQIAAITDQNLIGWSNYIGLDGEAGPVLSADGKELSGLLLAINDGGTAKFVALASDEADASASVLPTKAEAVAALTAAFEDWTGEAWIIDLFKVTRVAVDTVTLVPAASAGAANAALAKIYQRSLAGALSFNG